MRTQLLFLILFVLLIVAFFIDVMVGSAHLPLADIWKVIMGGSDSVIYQEIVLNHRLPKAITAILAGASLSVAGVLMQTLFHNPLAGPEIGREHV